MSRSAFNFLTDDLICVIFRLLNQQSSSRFSHALVCKRWHGLACLTQTTMFNTSHNLAADADLLKTLSQFKNLASLTINGCEIDEDGEFLLGLGSVCPKLTHLDLNNPREAALTYEGMDALSTACTRLQHLSLNLLSHDGNVPPSLFSLPFLTELSLLGNFEDFPEQVGELSPLKKLTLGRPNFSELPEFVGRLTELTELRLMRCAFLANLPESFGGLSSLVKLTIRDAQDLEELPDAIGQLQSLQECFLHGELPLVELPGPFFQITSLRILELVKCDEFEWLPDAMSRLVSLESLTIESCKSFNSLPGSICSLCTLRVLIVRNCPALDDFPQRLDGLTALERLELYHLKSLTVFPDTYVLPNLQTFCFNYCNSITDVPPALFQRCSGLTSLEFGWPASSEDTQVGGDVSAIHSFMSSLCQLSSLSTLLLFGLPGVTSLPRQIRNLSQLQRLTLCSCPDLRSLTKSIWELTSLRALVVLACPAFEDENDANLRDLDSGWVDGRLLGAGKFFWTR
ncbi:hypothetical protein CLOM_g1885 [Closterium sp. NIES-68]|nr:hypothetical protein CLOM_g19836 [Closterium sp. NIES-68]GJP42303.1 hypothetical protein CLOM_g1885 [Closterium sp. NIES-68]GJP84498.1 hypothetical protein CLOP_g14561 [Closterium sp. NIES-67]